MNSQKKFLDRRAFLKTSALISGAFFISPKFSFKQQDSPVTKIIDEASRSPVVASRLAANLTLLTGSGGNIILMNGRDSNLLVDAGIDVSREKMKAAIAGISKAPLRHLVNTHWHFDHSSGNAWIHDEGAEITAHENTKKWMSQAVRVDDWNYNFPAAPAGALPTVVFAKEHKIEFEGHTLHLNHYGPAHTDSDIAVHFRDHDVLHVADTWWNGHYPFIDYNTGGGIHGMIRAAEENVKRAGKKTIIVPGHGPVGNKAELIEYRDMLVAIEQTISGLKKSGRNLEDVLAEKPTKRYDEKWGDFVIGPDFFTRLVYKGIA